MSATRAPTSPLRPRLVTIFCCMCFDRSVSQLLSPRALKTYVGIFSYDSCIYCFCSMSSDSVRDLIMSVTLAPTWPTDAMCDLNYVCFACSDIPTATATSTQFSAACSSTGPCCNTPFFPGDAWGSYANLVSMMAAVRNIGFLLV